MADWLKLINRTIISAIIKGVTLSGIDFDQVLSEICRVTVGAIKGGCVAPEPLFGQDKGVSAKCWY